MGYFKYLAVTLLFLVLASVTFISSQKPQSVAIPFNSHQQYFQKLKQALTQEKFNNFQNIDIIGSLNICTFEINHENRLVKIVFSLKKDPYFQVASLQKILKIAKMKKQYVSHVDLSITHPYATLKNY